MRASYSNEYILKHDGITVPSKIIAAMILLLVSLTACDRSDSVLEVIQTYPSEEECEAQTGCACGFVSCDYVPEGKSIEETCGKDFKKGWACAGAPADITEDEIGFCDTDADCMIVGYSSCCGATKRAINREYLDSYYADPEWQKFDDMAVCARIGICPDDSQVTSTTCSDRRCTLAYP